MGAAKKRQEFKKRVTYKKSLRDITTTRFNGVSTDFVETDKEIFDNWFRKTSFRTLLY